MYSGVYEDLDPLETPINLFETDVEKIKKYKLMRIGDIYSSEMQKGGCLYIPAYYWFQSETVGLLENESGISSFITFEYVPAPWIKSMRWDRFMARCSLYRFHASCSTERRLAHVE